MTSARSSKIDLNFTAYYHCMTRCVRHTFLCGKDRHSGQDYSHRKIWIVNRIHQLASIFAIKICAYAVMSNHYHIVLFVNQDQANGWSEEEVLKRWAALFPRDADSIRSIQTGDTIQKRIAVIRERLFSISWFMRCLNEIIARLCNREDKVSGRFWEGRFKSQALLDDGALLAAMAYVDLNPIRANLAKTPEESEFTSIYERIQALKKCNGIPSKDFSLSKSTQKWNQTKQPAGLMILKNLPLNKSAYHPHIQCSLTDYLNLVDCTGRILREKKANIPNNLMPILFRLHLTPTGWMNMTTRLEEKFFDAIGEPKQLADFKKIKKRGPRGVNAAKQYYQQHAA